MDVLPSLSLFRELENITDTGYFEWKFSFEEYWQQVSVASQIRRGQLDRLRRFIYSEDYEQNYYYRELIL